MVAVEMETEVDVDEHVVVLVAQSAEELEWFSGDDSVGRDLLFAVEVAVFSMVLGTGVGGIAVVLVTELTVVILVVGGVGGFEVTIEGMGSSAVPFFSNDCTAQERGEVFVGEGVGDAMGEDADDTPEEEEASEHSLTFEDELSLEETLEVDDILPWDEMLRADETLEAEMRLPMVVLCSSCSDSVSVLDWSRLRRHDSLDLRLRA